MEIKLPLELESAMAEEIANKPGMDRRSYVLGAIRDKIAHDRGYRERAENRRKTKGSSAGTD